MRTLAIVLLIAVLQGLALIVVAPAALVASPLNDAGAGVVRLVDTEGLWWKGRGALAVGDARLPLAWSVDAGEVLRGRLTVRLHAADVAAPAPAGVVSASGDSIALSDIALVLPAGAVAAPFTAAAGLTLGGDIALTIRLLEYRDGVWRGQATVAWRRARVAGAPGQPAMALGEVTTTLVGKGEKLAGPLVNSGGRAAIRGELALGQRPRATASVLVTPRRGDDEELSRLLAAAGRAEAGGWRIDWRAPTR